MMRKRTFLLTALAFPAIAAPLAAQEIYRWVDENGVVNFSETAPAETTAGVSRVVVEDTRPSDYDPEEDIYDVAGQAERMAALREQRAREREARLERQQSVAPQQTVVQQPTYGRIPPWWWSRPGYPRPPMKPRPPRPEPYETSTLRPPGRQ